MSMRSIYCGDVNEKSLEQEVTLCGWVNRRRDLGGLIFIDMRDKAGIVRFILTQTKRKLMKLLLNYVMNFVLKLLVL